MKQIFQMYLDSICSNEKIGRPAFIDVISELTKRGEERCALSTFYSDISYFGVQQNQCTSA